MRGFWIAVAYLLVLAALAHPLGQALPRRWFDGGRFPYRCYKWEKQGKIYTRIGIERWKKLVPDMSRFLPAMVKKEVDPAAVTATQIKTPQGSLTLNVKTKEVSWDLAGQRDGSVVLEYMLLVGMQPVSALRVSLFLKK